MVISGRQTVTCTAQAAVIGGICYSLYIDVLPCHAKDCQEVGARGCANDVLCLIGSHKRFTCSASMIDRLAIVLGEHLTITPLVPLDYIDRGNWTCKVLVHPFIVYAINRACLQISNQWTYI